MAFGRRAAQAIVADRRERVDRTVKRELHKELECLHLDRPDFEQSGSPELREWLVTPEGQKAAQKIESANRRALEVLSQVDVPGHLFEQIVQGVRHLQADARSSENPISQNVAELRPVVEERKRLHPWTLKIAMSLAGCLLVSVVMAVALWPQPKVVTREGIAQQVLQQASALTDQTWFEVTTEVLATAPLPEGLTVQPVRWSVMSTEWDSETVVYDLGGPENSLAMLFVARVPTKSRLSERFPEEPDYFTGTLSVASAHQGGNLYVLMVEGSVETYRSLLVRIWPFG